MGPPVDAADPRSGGSPSPALCQGSLLLMSVPRSQVAGYREPGSLRLTLAYRGQRWVLGCLAVEQRAVGLVVARGSVFPWPRGVGAWARRQPAGAHRIKGYLELMRAHRRAVVLGHTILGWAQELRLLNLSSRSP